MSSTKKVRFVLPLVMIVAAVVVVAVMAVAAAAPTVVAVAVLMAAAVMSVQGRAVKSHGKLVDIDVHALRRRVEGSVDGLFARANVKRDGNWLPDPYVGGTEAKVDKKR
jgi:hypothetical protein